MTPTATGSSTGPGTLAGATSLAGPTTAWAHLAGYAPPQPVSIEERPLSSAASVPIPTRDEYLGSSYYTERAPIVIDNGKPSPSLFSVVRADAEVPQAQASCAQALAAPRPHSQRWRSRT